MGKTLAEELKNIRDVRGYSLRQVEKKDKDFQRIPLPAREW